MKRIALILMLLAIAVTMAAAQQRSRLVQSLSYSGVQLKLGDPEEATIQQLRKFFTVDEMPGGSYGVTKKNSKEESVGVITFHAGKLVSAYRDWTPNDPSAYALVVALKGAMETLKNQGSCAVGSGSVQEPNHLVQSSSVICGNKIVQVTATESSQLPRVMVYEWLIDVSPN